MKPKTKLQKQVVELSKKLSPLTKSQKQYAFMRLFEKFGYYWKKGEVWCQCCGYVDQVTKPMLAVSLNVESHVCPNCGTNLRLEHWNQSNRKILSEAKCYSVVQSFKEWMVIRTFHVRRDNIKGCDTHIQIDEIYQNWLSEDGKEVILGKKYSRSPFYLSWHYDSEMDVKQHNHSATGYYEMEDVFDVTDNYFYPVMRSTALLKRNGWTNKLLKLKRISVVDVMKQLLTNPVAETMVKSGQLSVFQHMLLKGNYAIPYQHALNICNRNGYVVEDASMWFDYLELLDYFNLDTHNAKYVCPEDLQAEHNRLLGRKRRIEKKKEEEERRKNMMQWEKEYRQMKGKFFGVHFGDDNIVIAVIESVAEMAEEGDAMHHCVFDAGYYKKQDSLILSAKDKDGKRLETIEVNLKSLKVVQSRSVCNGMSAHHKEILDLVNKNMNLIRKRLIA